MSYQTDRGIEHRASDGKRCDSHHRRVIGRRQMLLRIAGRSNRRNNLTEDVAAKVRAVVAMAGTRAMVVLMRMANDG